MMQYENLNNMPMSFLEQMLKQCLLQRPDIQNHILSSDELTEYISWMAENYRDSVNITPENLPLHLDNSQMSAITNQFLEKQSGNNAIHNLSAGLTQHSEERFLITDYDISVSRILRYMPSHWHTNSYFEMFYAFSGTCHIHFRDEIVEMKPGTILIVAPSAVHASPCYSDDCILMFYNIRASTFNKVFWNQLPADSLMSAFFKQALSGQHPTSYLHFETNGDEGINHLLQQIYHEYNHDAPYKAQLLNALMSTFFILLLRDYEGTARLPRTEDFFWKHQFSAILSHIQTHYATVTLDELSERYHYSQRQISRIVKGCMGMTYNQLILKLRMEKAAVLLRQQNSSIEKIAYAVGYSTVSSFYRTFTKYYGCTPKQYLADT